MDIASVTAWVWSVSYALLLLQSQQWMRFLLHLNLHFLSFTNNVRYASTLLSAITEISFVSYAFYLYQIN